MKNAPDKTAIESALDKPHSKSSLRHNQNPLISWHALAAPLLKRQQKRQKRGRR